MSSPEPRELICYDCLRLRKEGDPKLVKRKLKVFRHIRALAMHKRDAHGIDMFAERAAEPLLPRLHGKTLVTKSDLSDPVLIDTILKELRKCYDVTRKEPSDV